MSSLFSITLVSGDSAEPAPIANVVAFAGPLPGATVGQVYKLNPGDDPATITGADGGDILDDLAFHLRRAKVGCLICPSTITWGTLNTSVTQTGTGANFTVALDDALLGPFANFTFKGKITKAGANNVAVLEYNLDGGAAYPYALTIPDESPAVNRGTVDLTSSVPAMNGLTLIFTAPSSVTITFASSPTTPQGLADAFNTLAIAGSLAVRARVAEDSDGIFLELYTTSKGGGVTMTISASSTGEATLGLATTAKTGSPATFTFPWLNVVATFDAGTYNLGDTFTFDGTGPTSSIAALDAAADALRAQFYDPDGSGFASLVPLIVPATANNAAALEADFADKLLDWISDTQNTPALVYTAVPTPFHTASATASTNAANINTNDADVSSAWSSAPASHATVVHGDVYRDVSRDGGKLKGSFRRPAVLAWALRRAALPLSADPGEGVQELPGMSLKHPDGVTFARAENDPRVTAKLGGYKGPGFVVLRAAANGKPALDVGVTRAGAGDRFSKIGALAAIYYLIQQMLPNLTRERARRFALQTSGAMTDDEHASIETRLNANAVALLRDPEEPHASSVEVAVDGSEKLVDTDNITVTYVVQPFGYPETITIVAKLTGVITSIAA